MVKRKIIVLGITALLLLLFPLSVFAADPAVNTVEIDGKPIVFDQAPIVKNSRTFVQFRPTFEDLGMKVEWDSAARKVTGTKAGYKIELFIGKTEAYVNGTPYQLDAAPFITGSYTMIPLRFISEATGRFVRWDVSTRLISIVATDLSQFTDLFYADGFTYNGDLKDGVRDGKGRLVYSNGVAFYEGDFVQGKLEGQGKYFDKNGYVLYEGGWLNNLPDGDGKWYYGDGTLKYEGQYKAGKRDGKGTFVWRLSDGQVEAPTADQAKELQGINKYVGSFKNDKFDGEGTVNWADGASYKGGFADGLAHGHGELVWADKWKYVGDFAYGVRSGSGSLYNADGKLIYKGQFKNNQYSGKGELYDASGNSIFKGAFVNGKPAS